MGRSQERVTYDSDGLLDEVVRDKVTGFHMERMSNSSFWIGVHQASGSTIIRLWTRGSRLCAMVEAEPPCKKPRAKRHH